MNYILFVLKLLFSLTCLIKNEIFKGNLGKIKKYIDIKMIMRRWYL